MRLTAAMRQTARWGVARGERQIERVPPNQPQSLPAPRRLIEQQWTDETLKQVQTAFGRQETNAQILMGLIKHIVHHRGQATVLIRQAGLKPFGVYGPPKEDWARLGVDIPPL
jgi:hypothetical protein